MTTKDTGIQTTFATQTTTVYSGSPSYEQFPANSERRYMSGVSIPNFHLRKQRGELLPHTPFSQVEWQGQWISGSGRFDYNSGPNWFEYTNWRGSGAHNVSWRLMDFVDYNVDPTTVPVSAIPDYFVQQAAARIYSGGFDALTASAEMKKTVDGFRGVTRRMLDLASRFSTKRMLQLWLEGRYAWRTLAYDVRDLHSALTEFEAKREIWTERAGTSYSTESSELISSTSNTYGAYELTRDSSHRFSLRGSVAGLIKPSRFLADPFKTAWELVPYSFVVDWVYDVGTAIDAYRFVNAASQWTASKGFECQSTVEYREDVSSSSSWSSSGSTSYRYEGTRQVRSPVSTIPTLPQRTNRALTWDLSLDLQALATVRSKFR